MSKRFVVALGVLGLVVATTDRVSAGIVGPTDDRRPVIELDANDPLRALSKPIGSLLVTIKKNDDTTEAVEACTAAIISPSHVLTTSYCVTISGWDGWNAKEITRIQLRVGMDQADRGTKSFDLRLPPLQVNTTLDFAVLEVEGNPALEFGAAALLVRDPIPGEKLVVFQWSPGDGRLMFASEDCAVPTVVASASDPRDPAQIRRSGTDRVPHTCDTLGGSGGALLFSRSDRAVVGLHAYGGGGTLSHNTAISMRAIVEASPTIASVAWLRNPPQIAGGESSKSFAISILDYGAFSQIREGGTIKVNGKSHRVANVQKQGQIVTLLGEKSAFLKGLNELDIEALRIQVWNEEAKLERFDNPYKKSYAIIAAIDAYDRAEDPLVTKKFEKLDGMVARAEELVDVLVSLGFPKENVIWLPNEKARTRNINDALEGFWDGGPHAGADRLIFYFGGHGASRDRKGYLVTHDMKDSQPTLTGVPMSDFSGRHFPNINANQFLVLLDSCSSGLAVDTMRTLEGQFDERELKGLATLVTIRDHAVKPARQLLVAGTGDEKALWLTGGVFTQALIEGLKGKADYTKDGIVQLEELKLYLQQTVVPVARAKQLDQKPVLSTADIYGKGNMLFLLPRRE